jgi:hypothetical protein
MSATKPELELAVAGAACDTARLRAALDAWMVAHGRQERIADLGRRRIFWVPGAECNVVYEAVLRRGADTVTQTLTVRPCDDTTGERWDAKAERKARNGKFAVPLLGAPAYHLPALGVAVWTFPNDPDLKTLGQHVQQPPRDVLARLAAASGRGELAAGDATRTPVRYIPGKRCVLRYDVAATEGIERGQVFAKVYEGVEPARDAHAVLEALWRAAAGDAGSLRVPEPLALDTEAWTTYQRGLAGTPMAAMAMTPMQATLVGRAVARLHLLRLPVHGVFRLEDEHAKLASRAAAVAAVHPAFATAVAALVHRLGALLPELPRLPLVPSHGTFKLAHLLQDGARIGLVDFDSFVQADPLYDVANFTADLHYLEAAGMLPAGRAARLGAAVHDAWCAHVPWGRRDAVLDWYVASLLVRKQAMKCVKHLHRDAGVKIGRLVEAAARRVAAAAP